MFFAYRRGLSLLSFLILFHSSTYAQNLYVEEGENKKLVQYFDVQGLRLNMNLDKVRRDYSFRKVVKIKDELDVISEYEITKRTNRKILILRFTGEKRLYRINFVNTYNSFKKNADGLYTSLLEKYGEPYLKRKTPKNSETGNIFSCWGNDCDSSSYTPYAPKFTANIQYLTGKVRLVLADHSIHRSDWKKYKLKREAARQKKRGIRKSKNRKKINF